jgi:hypothetical protein
VPSPAALESAYAKLQRAQVHKIELFTSAGAWATSVDGSHKPPIERSDEMLPDGSEVVTYTVTESELKPPQEFSLILGDVFVNYRAALDHAAWALVSRYGLPSAAGKQSQIAFPVFTDREQFKAKLAHQLPGVDAGAISVVTRYQPFTNDTQAERHPLYLMNEAVRRDKHRTISVIAINAVKMTVDAPQTLTNFVVDKVEQLAPVDKLLPGTELLRIYGRRPGPVNRHLNLRTARSSVSSRWPTRYPPIVSEMEFRLTEPGCGGLEMLGLLIAWLGGIPNWVIPMAWKMHQPTPDSEGTPDSGVHTPSARIHFGIHIDENYICTHCCGSQILLSSRPL